NEYLGKGSGVLIEGRLKLDQWDDKQTGQKRSKLLVTGDRMQMLPRGGGSGDGGGSFQDSNPAPPAQSFQQQPQGNQGAQQFQAEPAPPENPPSAAPPVDDDIPF
ncbi:MAG: single-stranded DNA-binding protein, partial [Pirellulaceae bacterium]